MQVKWSRDRSPPITAIIIEPPMCVGVNSLPKTVIRQRRGCDFNPSPFAPESSALTARLLNVLPLATMYVATCF